MLRQLLGNRLPNGMTSNKWRRRKQTKPCYCCWSNTRRRTTFWQVVKPFYYLERFIYSTPLWSKYVRRWMVGVYGIYFTLATEIDALALGARGRLYTGSCGEINPVDTSIHRLTYILYIFCFVFCKLPHIHTCGYDAWTEFLSTDNYLKTHTTSSV